LSILLPLVSFFTDLRGIFPTDGCQRYRALSTFYLLVRPCCWGSDTGCRPLTAGETFVVALDMAGTSNPQSAIRRFPPLITHLYPVPATKARSRPSFLPIFSSPYLQATFLVTFDGPRITARGHRQPTVLASTSILPTTFCSTH
jgi:hypothetical protein